MISLTTKPPMIMTTLDSRSNQDVAAAHAGLAYLIVAEPQDGGDFVYNLYVPDKLIALECEQIPFVRRANEGDIQRLLNSNECISLSGELCFGSIRSHFDLTHANKKWINISEIYRRMMGEDLDTNRFIGEDFDEPLLMSGTEAICLWWSGDFLLRSADFNSAFLIGARSAFRASIERGCSRVRRIWQIWQYLYPPADTDKNKGG